MVEIEQLLENIPNAVKALRQGRNGESNHYLVCVTGGLIAISEALSQESLERLSPIINVLSDAQQKKDMMFVADILQYELPVLLKSL